MLWSYDSKIQKKLVDSCGLVSRSISVVRPKAPVKGLFVDSKYNPVLEGYQPHPQIEDRLFVHCTV